MIIKNGLVIDPASGLSEKMDLLIENGIIKEMATQITKEGEDVLDATGFVVAPGLIDTHVHFRDPGFTYKETIHTGALASAKGGFTSVICMANTSPTVDSVPVLRDNLERASKEKIRIFQAASISCNLKGQEETDMDALKEAGACGFTDDGIPLMNAEFCYHAMEKAAKLNVPVSLHEEDPSFIRNNGISHGKVSDALGIYGSPSIAEESLVARDCMLALKSGADVVIQHISSGISVDLVRTYRKMGANLHAEATPHHFTLTEDAVIKYGTLAKMNPPLREEEDRQAVIRGLVDGTIDMIATDHAPHTAEEKAKPITEAPSGITGLETSLALGITELVDAGYLTMKQLLRLMSTNPAAMYHLDAGYLAEGGPADVILIDTAAEFIPEQYASKATNTPFTGWKLKGEVKKTICGGKMVYEA